MYEDASNMAFRNGRDKIKNVFAHLKNSWKVLKCLNFNIPYKNQINISYCVLYKFCRMNNE